MSYHVYTTDGIILKRTAFGEADLLLHVLTKDLGLIIASARSARLSVSKLRPGLQEFSFISLSCIKGKNGWKITNVAYKDSFYFGQTIESKKIVAQIAKVLLQTITGEMSLPLVFEIVSGGIETLSKLSQQNIKQAEALILLRLLSELGYVAKTEINQKYLNDVHNWNNDLIENLKEDKEVVVQEINKALKVSQM